MGLSPDPEFVESYLEVQIEALMSRGVTTSSSAGEQLACVDLVCALGLMQGGVKPRASLLGPLLGVTQQVREDGGPTRCKVVKYWGISRQCSG